MGLTLLVEGPNRVGKDTFINAFLNDYPRYASRRCDPASKYSDNPEHINQYWQEYFQDLQETVTPSIWNRSHLSELVYAPRFRPQTCRGLYPFDLATAANNLRTRQQIVVVFLNAPYPFLQKRDTEETGRDPDYERSAYVTNAMAFNRLPAVQIDTQAALQWRNPGSLVCDLEDILNRMRLRI